MRSLSFSIALLLPECTSAGVRCSKIRDTADGCNNEQILWNWRHINFIVLYMSAKPFYLHRLKLKHYVHNQPVFIAHYVKKHLSSPTRLALP